MSDLVHRCPEEALEWWQLLPDGYDVAYGALIDSLRDDEAIVKREHDPVWFFEVNGNEYRGPIRFCPFCGERL